ncbi:uncharacterized protein PG986_010458 [Apiospora aurea]|uniref:Uncharacterized protein n=1 Tax=Apiospora aurea TaxID=335848 RepID=A0ABR1Q2E2_9PEZI
MSPLPITIGPSPAPRRRRLPHPPGSWDDTPDPSGAVGDYPVDARATTSRTNRSVTDNDTLTAAI